MHNRSHGALRTWIGHVWRPAEIDGLRADIDGRERLGHLWEQYYVLPHAQQPRLLVPVGDLASARRMVTARARLATRRANRMGVVARAALSVPTVARRLSTLTIVTETCTRPPLLIDELSRALQTDGVLQAVFTLRPPTSHTKPTIALFDRGGEPVAYAKLGVSPGTSALVRSEAATLRAIDGQLPSVLTPRLLLETSWFDAPVSISAPLPADVSRCDEGPDRMVHALMEIARSGEYGTATLSQSTYAAQVDMELAAVASLHSSHAELLRRWWEQMRKRDPVLTCGRSHGDWASWNLGRRAGRLVAWDWERSRAAVPIGFDYLHWYFSRKEVHSGALAAAQFLANLSGGLVAFGVTATNAQMVTSLYLFDRCLAELALSGDTDAPGLSAELYGVASRWATTQP